MPDSFGRDLGSGQALDASTRAFFESRFGAALGDVRVHTDAHAAQTARAVDARAFTTGRDVVFGVGQYAPLTREGRRLLAHELTHVLQQNAVSGQGSGGRLEAPTSAIQRDTLPLSPPATTERDRQIAQFLTDNPSFVGLVGLLTDEGFVDEAGGLKALERDYPSSYAIIRERMVRVLSEKTVAGLYRNDEAIMTLVNGSATISGRLSALQQQYLAQNRTAAYDWLAEHLPSYELTYADAASLYHEQGDAFFFMYGQLLAEPEAAIEQLTQLAEERQSEYSQRVEAGEGPVGSTIAELDVFMGFNDDVALEELLEPREGIETYREALVWARISTSACAVMEVQRRFYIYRLNHQYSLKDALATGFDRRSELLTRGAYRGITVTTTDGVILNASEGRYFVRDQTERPEENFAAGLGVLAEHGEDLGYADGFRLFRQMVRDLVLVNLAQARRGLNRELGRLCELGICGFGGLIPKAGEELQRDAAALRRHAIEAASLAEAMGDAPTDDELVRLEETLSAIGEIHQRNPTAALMVVNLRDENQWSLENLMAAAASGESQTGFRDRVAGMLPGDAATEGARELGRRLSNVEQVENHVLHDADAVLDMEPLHEPVLGRFPDDQRRMIEWQLAWHGLEQLAEALGMAVFDLALTITGFVVGGPLGFVIGGAATVHGVAQTLEAFEQVELMEAMTELDVYGEFALATPEMVSSARRWAWIGAGLTLLDVGGFVREGRHLARLHTVLASPDLAQVLTHVRRDFGDAAQALGTSERELARQLSIARGADRIRLVEQVREALEGRLLTRWEESLSTETQALLREDPALRKTFSDMSPAARRILTRCGSLCIPPQVTAAQRARIEGFLMRAYRMTGKSGRFGDAHEWMLREHFYARRNTLDEAIGAIERVTGLNELEATLRRTASERALGLRAASFRRAGDASPALPADPTGPVYMHAVGGHGAQRPVSENWERATGARRRGRQATTEPQGQWYDNRFIVEAERRANPGNLVRTAPNGAAIHEFDMPWPVGRVFMPNQTVISDVRRVTVLILPDGTFANAYPSPPPVLPLP